LNPRNLPAVEMTPRKVSILIITVIFLFTGCTSVVRYSSENHTTEISTTEHDTASVPDNSLNKERETIIKTASNYLGTPYCYGGNGDACFDCSGFVNAVYLKAGIDLPRVSRDIYKMGISVNDETVQPGDLVFFKRGNTINHVGIYYGDGKMIHASTSKGVVIQSLSDSYFSSHFAGYKSIIK